MYKNWLILSLTMWRSSRTLAASRTLGIVWDALGMITTQYQRTQTVSGVPLMTCSRCINRFLLIFVDFHWFCWVSLIFAKTNEKTETLMENQLIYRLQVIRETPDTVCVLWYCVVIIPKAPHTTPSILETTRELEERQIARSSSVTQLTLF